MTLIYLDEYENPIKTCTDEIGLQVLVFQESFS